MTESQRKYLLKKSCKEKPIGNSNNRKVYRNENLNKIQTFKQEETNLKMRNHWHCLIKDMEKRIRKQNEAEIKFKDLSTSLPPALYKRVAKIIPMVPIEEDRFEETCSEEETSEEFQEKKLVQPQYLSEESSFNESTDSYLKKLQAEFPQIEFNPDKETLAAKRAKKIHNWQARYINSNRKARVKWNSKIYHMSKNVWEMPLFEQAEHLMDAAAERFTDWVNSLGSNEETNISKHLLKDVFSIETGSKLLGGIEINPKEVRAVPRTVAQTWNVPEMSMDLKLAKKIESAQKNIPKQVIKVAFSRTLPYHMRPWVPSDAHHIIKPDFPEELRTREALFNGIGHLRSTRALVDFYKKNPDMPRPQYLVDIGCFNHIEKIQTVDKVPLYELLGLKIS